MMNVMDTKESMHQWFSFSCTDQINRSNKSYEYRNRNCFWFSFFHCHGEPAIVKEIT